MDPGSAGQGAAAWMEARRLRIDGRLARQVERWREQMPPRLVDAMGYSLLAGGKRLRPVLVLAGFEACGAPQAAAEVALDFAVALESIHTYSLIHDDLPAMDDDDLRRGLPTCHRKFDEATAILAGDALLTEAFALLASGPEPSRLELVGLLAQAAGGAGMVGGQHLDLELTGRPGELPELAQIEEVHRRKTGALLASAAVGGAIAAGAATEPIAALRHFGEALGLAFQIADDVLDVVGDPAKMGKSGGVDQEKGKATYPALVGLDRSRALAREARDRAVEAIAGLGEPAWPLIALADYAIERVN